MKRKTKSFRISIAEMNRVWRTDRIELNRFYLYFGLNLYEGSNESDEIFFLLIFDKLAEDEPKFSDLISELGYQ